MRKLLQLHTEVVGCERCARLREYCAGVAREKKRAYREWEYWGRPICGFGDARAWLWVVGLAPAAHGGNRTGRVFTGDRSGDFLYAALHRKGFANQPTSVHREDGLALLGCYISATVRCAPPGNKPLPGEIEACSQYLDEEWELLRGKRVLLALGKIAWDAILAMARRKGCELPRPRSAFGHGAVVELAAGLHLVGSYHVSQQNTFTGKLTERMFDDVLDRCGELAGVAIGGGRA